MVWVDFTISLRQAELFRIFILIFPAAEHAYIYLRPYLIWHSNRICIHQRLNTERDRYSTVSWHSCRILILLVVRTDSIPWFLLLNMLQVQDIKCNACVLCSIKSFLCCGKTPAKNKNIISNTALKHLY